MQEKVYDIYTLSWCTEKSKGKFKKNNYILNLSSYDTRSLKLALLRTLYFKYSCLVDKLKDINPEQIKDKNGSPYKPIYDSGKNFSSVTIGDKFYVKLEKSYIGD